MASTPVLNYDACSRTGCHHWSPGFRIVIIALASTPLLALVLEFYRPGSMRPAMLFIALPALAILALLTVLDVIRGNRLMARTMLVGLTAGLIALAACDLYRWPFTLGENGRLQLFAALPKIGLLLQENPPPPYYHFSVGYKRPSHWAIGWAYHALSAATFGVIYVALVGRPKSASLLWAPLLAYGAEAVMLLHLTPYLAFTYTHYLPNGYIHQHTRFLLHDLTAHLLYGLVLGLVARWLAHRWTPSQPLACPSPELATHNPQLAPPPPHASPRH